jgi:hypothetical protein
MPFVGEIIGGYAQAEGAKSASRTQADAANRATDLQRQQYEQQRADNMPAIQARNSSLAQLKMLLGLSGQGQAGFGSMAGMPTPQNVQGEAGYQFGLTQGNQNIQRGAAARGGLYSGQAMKALSQYGNDYATTKYNDAYNRILSGRQSVLNPLQSLAGLGQSASAQVGQAGQNYANNAGNNMMGAANANAAGQLSAANIFGNMLNKGAANNWWQGNGNQYSGNEADVNFMGPT